MGHHWMRPAKAGRPGMCSTETVVSHGLGRAPAVKNQWRGALGCTFSRSETEHARPTAPYARIRTMTMTCETTMHSTMIFRLVTTFQSACFIAASPSSGWRGVSLLGWPTGENPGRRRGFRKRSGDRFGERDDLGENNDQDHELQVGDHVQQGFFHDGLLKKKRG